MIKRILKTGAFLAILGAFVIGLIIARVQLKNADAIEERAENLRPAPTAIILGASVRIDGTPSDALYDRVLTGIELYQQGKVGSLLMTGDNGAFHVNEVEVMARIAREAGVSEEDILVDGQGYRTYESCKRAVQVYDIRRAIVVTQRFHLGRALYLCDSFGMEVQGFPADRRPYKDIVFFKTRDLAASFKAWLDVNIYEPAPPVR